MGTHPPTPLAQATDPGAQTDVPGRTREANDKRNEQGQMTTIEQRHRRVAYCDCGARLAGASEEDLFDSAQRHLAHHHPQLLGALGLDLVQQMAEDVGG
jgi:hypothetical protein